MNECAWNQDCFSSVQFSSVAQSWPTLRDTMDCSMPGFPVPHHLPMFAQTHANESVMPSNHLILCCLFRLLPSIFPSIRVFSNEFILPIRWLEFWEFQLQLQHQSFQWIFMVDFLEDWLVSSCSARDSRESSPAPQFRRRINSLALSLLYSPTVISVHATGKTIALTIQTFVSKMMSLLFSTLSRFVIAFLQRSKHL